MADATVYVVYRSDAPDGPFVSAARVDVATGPTTVTFTGTFVHIVIWQPTAESFEYVEAGASSGTGAHFRVVALNAGGAGPASAVVCGAPPGDPDC